MEGHHRMKASFDISRNLDLYFRRRRNGVVTLTFMSEGVAYDLTGLSFEFRSDFLVTASIALNVLTLSFSSSTIVSRASYFWELYNVTQEKTWLSGTAFFTESLSAEVKDSQSVDININGDQVAIEINSSDVNGGTP